jgi:hypothetical protein
MTINDIAIFNDGKVANDNELLTTTQLVKMLNTSNNVIFDAWKKATDTFKLNLKVIENGKTTYWNKNKITYPIYNFYYYFKKIFTSKK